MKISNQFLVMALVIAAMSLISLQLLAQNCVTCDTIQSNIKIGYNNNVNSSWTNQSILGNNNTTSRNNAVAIGTNSTASGSHSYVFGSNSASNGLHAYAIGTSAIAQSTYSYAFGQSAKSMFGNAFVVGNFTRSDAVGAYVFGLGVSSAIPLVNTVGNSLAIGFISTKPTLFVSESPYSANYDLTGRVGIGNITAPQAKLHIRGDAQEDATLRLEATGFQKQSRLYFTEAHQIRAAGNGAMHFHSSENKGFIFHDGDIYLHDIQSGIIMKSPNGQCWRGTLNDQGNLQFAVVTCPGLTTGNKPEMEAPKKIRIYPNPASTHLHIESEQELRNALVLVSSLDGRSSKSQQVTGNAAMLDISGLARGAYIVNILENEFLLATQQLIVQ